MSANNTSKMCNSKAPDHKVEAMKEITMVETWQTSQDLKDGAHQWGNAVATVT